MPRELIRRQTRTEISESSMKEENTGMPQVGNVLLRALSRNDKDLHVPKANFSASF